MNTSVPPSPVPDASPVSPASPATSGSSAAPPLTAETDVPGRGGGWLASVTALVAMVAILAVVVLWQRLDRIQQELAKRSADVVEQVGRSRELAERTDAQSQELQARLSVAEIKLSEVSLQRTQLEELMLSVSRSRDDTLVLDIESGLRLAMQQTELTGSAQPLLSALIAADQRIARAAQPRLNPVQRAIGRDIDRIKASSVADLPALASQLDELARLVSDMPLLNAAPDVAPPASAVVRRPTTPRVPKPARKTEQSDDTLAVAPPDPWHELQLKWDALWAQTVAQVTQAMSDLVRVSRIDEPDAVLLAPEQSVFLRENLTLKLINARLGLLSRQLPAARADMQSVRTALQKYFDPESVLTRKSIQTLTDALQITRTIELPRPDDTLTALAAAAKGR